MIAHPSCSEYFNPRSREGSDAYAKYSGRYLIDHFNPRSREGSDADEWEVLDD